jgi:hypothetical protein
MIKNIIKQIFSKQIEETVKEITDEKLCEIEKRVTNRMTDIILQLYRERSAMIEPRVKSIVETEKFIDDIITRIKTKQL